MTAAVSSPDLVRQTASAPPSPTDADVHDEGPSAGVMTLIGLTVMIGLLAQVAIPIDAASVPSVSWVGLAVFAGLIVVAELLSADIGGRSNTSVSVITILAASLLYGATGALVSATAFAVAGKIDSHSPFHRMFFNFGNMLVAIACAVWMFQQTTGSVIGDGAFHQLIVSAVLAGLTFYAIQHALLCLVRGLDEQRNPLEIWRADFQWLWPHYAILGVLGMFLAVVYVTFGWAGVVALTAPGAMMQLTVRQYVTGTTSMVRELQHLNSQLADSHDEILRTLSRALDTRDAETEDHSQRVRRYAELIARAHGLSADEIDHLSRGALLHDIGKIGVPDAILLKPGKLSDDEWALVRKHPQIGYSMIADVPFLERAAEVVRYHHEAYDGSGYPDGLAGAAIPLNARIFAVADTLDAMTSDRPYRSALSLDAALTEIARCSGSQFDPAIVSTLLDCDHCHLEAVLSSSSHSTVAKNDAAIASSSRSLRKPIDGTAPAACERWPTTSKVYCDPSSE